MIIAIERNKFIYLYKYNQVNIDINQVIDLSIEELTFKLKTEFEFVVNELNRVLPVFEEDHEILLLEVSKSHISIQGRFIVFFNAINCIYPLSEIGSQLLAGKINSNFIVKQPLFEIAIEEVKIIRSIENRKIASHNLLSYHSLTNSIDDEKLNLLKSTLRKVLLDKKVSQHFTTYLDHLLSYNKTPSYLPEGHVEYLCKIGVVAIKYLGKLEEAFKNGPFYNSCLKHKKQLNIGSIYSSYETFLSIPDEEFKSSYGKVKEIISRDFSQIDVFKASYFFIAFKSYLNQHENNLLGIENDINQLKSNDKEVAAFVVSMLGYTFSFEQLYESLHIFSKAPLFTNSIKSENVKKITIGNRSVAKVIIAEDAKLKNKRILPKGHKSETKVLISEESKSKNIEILLEEEKRDIKDKTPNEDKSKFKEKLSEEDKSEFGELMPKDDKSIINPILQEELKSDLKGIMTEESKSEFEEYIIEDEKSIITEIIVEESKSEINEKILKNDNPENDESVYTIDNVTVNIGLAEIKLEQENIAMTGISEYSQIRNKKPIKSSLNNKVGLSKKNVEPKDNKSLKNKQLHSLVNLTKDLIVNPTIQFPELDTLHYYDIDLMRIVDIVQKNGVFNDSIKEKTFDDAMMGYSPKGANQDLLLNEVDELKKDLKLSQGIADQLRSIILEVKK